MTPNDGDDMDNSSQTGNEMSTGNFSQRGNDEMSLGD